MVYSMNFDIFHIHGHFSQIYESYDHMDYNIDGDMLKIIKATNSKTVLSIYMWRDIRIQDFGKSQIYSNGI